MKAAFVLLSLILIVGCTQPSDAPVKEFSLESKQFEFIPSIIEVNQGDRVRISISATDIPHGFAITEYGVTTITPVGEITTVDFIADKKGNFTMFCTVFCGVGHPNHKGVLVVK